MERKISIITPVYNGEKYIEKCILSIRNQNYSNYEHIIMDGGSTDSTLEIINKYKSIYPVRVISEKDNGMYDAIVKGFDLATGDIFAWLNADDVYMPWAFQIMNYVISRGVSWCTAINSFQNEMDVFFKVNPLKIYRRDWIFKGMYDGRLFRFIQQESTFWTRDLWIEATGKDIAKYKMAGDYWLWRFFAKYTELYTVNTVIGGFRFHQGQKSSDIDTYYKEAEGDYAKNIVNTKILRLKEKVFQKNVDLVVEIPMDFLSKSTII